MKKILLGFLCLFSTGCAQASLLSDINTHPNQEAIEYVYDEGIVDGYSDGTYQPNKTINRAEFTKIIVGTLYHAEDIETCESASIPFSDMTVSAWYAPYICMAWQENLISGYPDNTFRPEQNITFVEAAKIIDISFDGEYIDASPWYKPYVKNLSNFGVIPTTIERLEKNITRGEMAEMIWRWETEIDDKDAMSYENDALIETKADEIIFGFDADGPNDCEDGEIFDAEYKMCFLAEDLEIQEELDNTFGDFGTAKFSHSEDDSYQDDADLIIKYSIEGNTLKQKNIGQILSTEAQAIANNSRLHKQIWEQFYQIIPQHQAKEKIVEFVLFSGKGENEGTLAYVHQREEDSTKWVLGVNVPENFNTDGTLKDTKDFYYTLIHEFFHVVSLEESNTTNTSICGTYEIETGCLKANTPLGKLVEDFWKQSPHWEGFMADPENEDEAYDRYDQTPQRYVTEYAATNPGEDVSEVFAHFVLKPQPTGQSVKDKKILQMFDNSHLVNLRKALRTNLAKIKNKPLRQKNTKHQIK
jgi:hypothetical protein